MIISPKYPQIKVFEVYYMRDWNFLGNFVSFNNKILARLELLWNPTMEPNFFLDAVESTTIWIVGFLNREWEFRQFSIVQCRKMWRVVEIWAWEERHVSLFYIYVYIYIYICIGKKEDNVGKNGRRASIVNKMLAITQEDDDHYGMQTTQHNSFASTTKDLKTLRQNGRIFKTYTYLLL